MTLDWPASTVRPWRHTHRLWSPFGTVPPNYSYAVKSIRYQLICGRLAAYLPNSWRWPHCSQANPKSINWIVFLRFASFYSSFARFSFVCVINLIIIFSYALRTWVHRTKRFGLATWSYRPFKRWHLPTIRFRICAKNSYNWPANWDCHCCKVCSRTIQSNVSTPTKDWVAVILPKNRSPSIRQCFPHGRLKVSWALAKRWLHRQNRRRAVATLRNLATPTIIMRLCWTQWIRDKWPWDQDLV